MRRVNWAVILAFLVAPAGATTGQTSTSPEAQRATQHYRAGWALMTAEQYDRAAAEFQEAARIDPKFALAYYALGRAEMSRRRFAEAVLAYQKCRQAYLDHTGEGITSQAENNRKLDDQILQYKEVLKQYGQAGNQASRSDQIRRLQLDLQQLELARSRNVIMPLDVKVPFFVSMSLGAAYFRLERFADAEREYKVALDDNPHSGETHNNLAVLYMLTARLDDAAREIDTAERNGFKVHPDLKEELRQKRGK